MSYGQSLCREYLEALVPAQFQENARPDWLHGLELDFFFPEHGFAVEFNGDQHYFATGLSADPGPQKRRDAKKRFLCKQRGVILVAVKAIDLVAGKMRLKLKRYFELNHGVKLSALDKRAKEYRKTLIEKYASPTAHRGKGAARKKTVARLFEQFPPQVEGKWNNDVFQFWLSQWTRDHGRNLDSFMAFEEANVKHLRRRQFRQLAKIKAKHMPSDSP